VEFRTVSDRDAFILASLRYHFTVNEMRNGRPLVEAFTYSRAGTADLNYLARQFGATVREVG
jgi:hypothetical protein